MGSNRRYRHQVEDQIEQRVRESMMRQEPVSLTAAELKQSKKPVVQASKPVAVFAWVRYPSQAVKVQALAVAWTDVAVQISYIEPFIASQRTIWVWANAVERAERPPVPTGKKTNR